MNALKTAFFIAYKSIVRGRKGTFFLYMLILSLSFFNMMFIPSVFSGLLNTITQLEINTSTSDIAVSPQENPTPRQFIPNQSLLRAQINTIPGVIASTPVYLTAGSVSYDKDKNGVYRTMSGQIYGIEPSNAEKVLTLNQYLVAGQPLSDDDTDQIVLSAGIAGGYELPVASDLGGAKVGDKVNVTYANGITRTYTVKGIVKVVFGTALTSMYVSSKEAQSVLSTSDTASQILVKTDLTHNSLDYYDRRIQDLAPNLKVQTYTEMLAAIQPILKAFTLIAFIVSAISILVATVTIFVMIYINAVSKRRQIGILKAIGIKERIIVYSYVFQALFYVACGIFAGLVVVFGIATPILANYPIQLPFGPLRVTFGTELVTLSIIGFTIAGFISGFIPARLVAREEILNAIWG